MVNAAGLQPQPLEIYVQPWTSYNADNDDDGDEYKLFITPWH